MKVQLSTSLASALVLATALGCGSGSDENDGAATSVTSGAGGDTSVTGAVGTGSAGQGGGTSQTTGPGTGAGGAPVTGPNTGNTPIPQVGYVGSVGLQDVGVANYATYVVVNGVTKYWGYAIGGGLVFPPGGIGSDPNTHIVSVSAGGHSNMALDDTGHVWGAGGNIMGEMGLGEVGGLHEFYTNWTATTTDDQGKPFDHVVTIQETFEGSSALKDDGTLWFWGLNGPSEICGLPLPTTDCPWGGGPDVDPNCFATRPHQIQFPAGVKIQQYDAGAGTPLALDTNGKVWSWGGTTLVNGDFAKSMTPVQIAVPNNEPIVEVIASNSFFYVLGANGHLYGWASGVGGTMLGIGDGVYNWHPTPTPIDVTAQDGFTPLVGKIARVYANALATYVLDTDGQVWAWGSNTIGSVGNGPTGISQGIGSDTVNSWNWIPTEDMVMKPVKVLDNVAVFYTRAYTYNAFAVTKTGDLMAWGRDKFGNLGDGCIGENTNNDDSQPDSCDVGTPKSITIL